MEPADAEATADVEPEAVEVLGDAEPEAEPAEAEPAALEPAETAPALTSDAPVPAEWWFGSKDPPPVPVAASAPVRALAERLSAEGREALARIEAQLAALERVDLAKRSLEWHEANGSSEPAAEAPPEKA